MTGILKKVAGAIIHQPRVNVALSMDELEKIVQRAVSGEAAQYRLGKTDLDSYISEVNAVMTTSTIQMGNRAYPILTLETTLALGDKHRKTKNGLSQVIPIDTHYLKKDSLDVMEVGDHHASISHPKYFPKKSHISYNGTSGKIRYELDLTGLTTEQVSSAVNMYFRVVQDIINGAYRIKQKQSPTRTWNVHLGEPLQRIGAQIVSRPDVNVRQAPGSGRNGGSQPGQQDKPSDEDYKLNLVPIESSTTFNDIGGYDTLKKNLNDFISAITNPEEAIRHGWTPPKGALLYGPPGTGKTLFARALAGESKAKFLELTGADIRNKYVGDTEKAIRDAFEGAQKLSEGKPVIIFIDEIDSILPKRGTTHYVNDGAVNLFNQYMDGIRSQRIKNVYIVGATNLLGNMDESAIRAGRFEKFEVGLPDLEARTSIFGVTMAAKEREAGGTLFGSSIDYRKLATLADGLSGADIAQVIGDVRQDAYRRAKEQSGGKEVIIASAQDIINRISTYKTQMATAHK